MSSTLLGTTLVAYFVSSVLYLANLHIKERRLASFGNLLCALGFVVQTARIALQIAGHEAPFASASDAIFFFSWVFTGFYLFVLIRYMVPAVGALAMPLATVSLAMIYRLPNVSGGSLANGSWLKIHILAIVASLALYTLAFCCSVLYLVQNKLLKSKKLKGMFRRLPPLETIDSLGFHLSAVGFPLLTLGIVMGAIGVRLASLQAHNAGARLAMSALAWVVYAAYLFAHGRVVWRGQRANWVLIIGTLLIASIAALHKFS